MADHKVPKIEGGKQSVIILAIQGHAIPCEKPLIHQKILKDNKSFPKYEIHNKLLHAQHKAVQYNVFG